MEHQGRPGDDDLAAYTGAPPLIESDKLRNALGFPEPVETTPSARHRRRRAHLTEVVGIAESNGSATAPASTPSVVDSVEASAVWRADLNQLYGALTERLRAHSEDVTRQLTDERMRLAGLLSTVIEQVSKLSGAPEAPGGVDASAAVLVDIETQLAEIRAATRPPAEPSGLEHVEARLDEILAALAASQPTAPPAPASVDVRGGADGAPR